MDSHLRTQIENMALPPQIQNAAAAGLTKLTEYYKLACESQFNAIATGKSNGIQAHSEGR
jgi:hypothetical protein